MSTANFPGYHFINGQLIEPKNDRKPISIYNPSTGNEIGHMKPSDEYFVGQAVENSLEAYKMWSKLSPFQRGKYLLKASEVLEEMKEEISILETENNGKPIWESRLDVEGCIDSLRYFGGVAPTLTGEMVTLPNGNFGHTIREPLGGPVAAIGAWNYPFQIAVWKSAPALVCGNTVVFKPSQFSPLTCLKLGQVYKLAGLPDGAFNVIQGEGDVGGMLINHEKIVKVSFTGSLATGSKIMQTCSKYIKPVTLELGGKSPLIIFEDSDIENAINGTIMANFLSQGQVCSNGTRVYIQSSIYDRFVSQLVSRVEKIKIGDPMDEATRIGATINEDHFKSVLGFIDRAKSQGAKVLCGGQRVILPSPLSTGFYMSPCLVAHCRPDSEIAEREIFGPVACLFRFKSEEEVLLEANSSEFGLSAGVFTKDLNRAHRVASLLEAGTVYVNNYNVQPCELPFGGVKRSGIGRENGRAVLEHYTKLKSVYFETNPVDCPL